MLYANHKKMKMNEKKKNCKHRTVKVSSYYPLIYKHKTNKYTFLDGQVETVLSLSSALTEARALSYSIALTEVRVLCRRCRLLLPRQELCPIQLLLSRYERCVVVVVCSYRSKSFALFNCSCRGTSTVLSLSSALVKARAFVL